MEMERENAIIEFQSINFSSKGRSFVAPYGYQFIVLSLIK